METPMVATPGWLLKQDNMVLINRCRKYIQMEFGTRLQFSQADLLERIRDYSERSQNPALKTIVADLVARLPSSETESGAGTQVRMYRGQSVAIAASTSPNEAKPRRQVIYRGRVITE